MISPREKEVACNYSAMHLLRFYFVGRYRPIITGTYLTKPVGVGRGVCGRVGLKLGMYIALDLVITLFGWEMGNVH